MSIEEISPEKPQEDKLPASDPASSSQLGSKEPGHPLWEKFLRHSSFSVPVLIFLVGLAVYFNTIQNPMILDDYSNIIANPAIREIGLPQSHPVYFKIGTAGRPFSHFTFSLNYAISGLNVWSYHIFNIGIHILSGLALFGIIRRTLLTWKLKSRFGENSVLLACISSLLWVVHPLQTMSVTYLSQRCESLMGFCALLTFYFSIRGFQSNSNAWKWHILASLFCILGMGSKEVMVGIPLLVLLYDVIFIHGSWRDATKSSKTLYFGLTLSWIAMGLLLFGGRTSGAVTWEKCTFFQLISTQAEIIVYYLYLTFFPFNLCFDYRWPVTNFENVAAQFILVFSALMFSLYSGIISRKPIGFIGLSFFVILAPTSLLPIMGLAYENRMYLPLAPFISFIVMTTFATYKGFEERFHLSETQKKNFSNLVIFLLLAEMLCLSLLTVNRNRDFHSTVQIWRDTIKKRPDNFLALTNLGITLANENKHDEAWELLQKAISITAVAPALFSLGSISIARENLDDAIMYFQYTVKVDPKFLAGYFHLGDSLLLKGRIYEALGAYKQGLELQPYLAYYLEVLRIAIFYPYSFWVFTLTQIVMVFF